eukprot:CAMPEP_0178910248 /NCGR_PEP_ID=MMETSP0786-20121207/8991_1 /TAXON_ID=186022 /ORGANISM="Thalassionema frauenfeldii, Strain CCMP 1798" /LENGTH=723 /DNA_ID=CAMNT_0020582477 /DNA_START=293 /DNA_END=2460 /DNA_ORIENTATION=+
MAHERTRLDQLVKKVIRLVLSDHPVRSMEEFLNFGSTSVAFSQHQRNELSRQLTKGGYREGHKMVSSRYGQGFYTIAEACLVVMYERIRVRNQQDTDTDAVIISKCQEKENWVSLADLLNSIDARLRPEAPYRLRRPQDEDGGLEHYLQPSTRSTEFMQITKLECRGIIIDDDDEAGPLLKRHKVRGRVHYELLPSGYRTAQRLRRRSFPAPPGHYRTSKPAAATINPVYAAGKICIGVDRQEGGGGSHVLHEMCNKLDACRVPYFVGTLAIGDYVFFTSKKPDNNDDNNDDDDARDHRLNYYLCPILVERKSIQDVAMSIYDGRWKSQKARMYRGQYVFGYQNCRMVYIIEGNESKQLVDGNYVGNQWFRVHRDQLQHELDLLEQEGFCVMRTPSRENSMFELARWARRIVEELDHGTLRAEFTYEQFQHELKQIPKDTDFSRLAKYYAAERKEREAAAEEAAAKKATEENEGTAAAAASSSSSSSSSPAAAAAADNNPYQNKKRKTTSSYTTTTRRSPKTIRTTNNNNNKSASTNHDNNNKNNDDDDELQKYSVSMLQKMLKSVGLSSSVSSNNKKTDLIARYRGPHPPKVWLRRKEMKQYVPQSYNVGSTALLVALYLHESEEEEEQQQQQDNNNNNNSTTAPVVVVGLTKEELYSKAEGLNITKNPFSGGTTQTGPYHYDGWSNMRHLLSGDPALVVRVNGRFRLTRSCPIAGYPLGEA